MGFASQAGAGSLVSWTATATTTGCRDATRGGVSEGRATGGMATRRGDVSEEVPTGG